MQQNFKKKQYIICDVHHFILFMSDPVIFNVILLLSIPWNYCQNNWNHLHQQQGANLANISTNQVIYNLGGKDVQDGNLKDSQLVLLNM